MTSLRKTLSSKTVNVCPKYVFAKGFEIFIFAFLLAAKTYGCILCPEPIEQNEREDDFSDVEIHIGDAICMGNIENDIKGVPNDKLFIEEKSVRKDVKGINAWKRTFLKEVKHRQVISKRCSRIETTLKH